MPSPTGCALTDIPALDLAIPKECRTAKSSRCCPSNFFTEGRRSSSPDTAPDLASRTTSLGSDTSLADAFFFGFLSRLETDKEIALLSSGAKKDRPAGAGSKGFPLEPMS